MFSTLWFKLPKNKTLNVSKSDNDVRGTFINMLKYGWVFGNSLDHISE